MIKKFVLAASLMAMTAGLNAQTTEQKTTGLNVWLTAYFASGSGSVKLGDQTYDSTQLSELTTAIIAVLSDPNKSSVVIQTATTGSSAPTNETTLSFEEDGEVISSN